MKMCWIRKASLILAATLVVGCAGMNKPQEPLTFSPANFPTGKYAPKVDNFQIIVDASESMDINMFGEQEYPTARNFITSMNQSIPTDLPFNAGLRSFGHNPKQSKEATALPYGMTRYSRSGFAGGLDSIKHLGGVSPLSPALAAAGEDLKAAPGNSAIVIVSDGVAMEDAPAAAAKVNAEMGDRLCVYTVQVGNSPEGRKTLAGVAKAFKCGKAYAASDLANPDQFRGFVESVFLSPGKKVVADSDGDGVPDHLDKCPGTPKGVQVDDQGCPFQYSLRVEFDTDRAEIRSTRRSDLPIAAQFIKNNPGLPYILLAGHTDSIGSEAYNQKLSERRAEAVRRYFIENFGVEASKLVARGYGESKPVDTNDTEAGRQKNRRVEIIFYTEAPK
ncbi:MAG: OmpA family protein [Deltaproteobacteria bacterium]|nr:OmpA family protein [Deltaproteobacteria bacterium]